MASVRASGLTLPRCNNTRKGDRRMRCDANAIYTMAQIQSKQQTCRKGPVRVFSALVMHIAAPFRYLARSLKVNGKKKTPIGTRSEFWGLDCSNVGRKKTKSSAQDEAKRRWDLTQTSNQHQHVFPNMSCQTFCRFLVYGGVDAGEWMCCETKSRNEKNERRQLQSLN